MAGTSRRDVLRRVGAVAALTVPASVALRAPIALADVLGAGTGLGNYVRISRGNPNGLLAVG